MLILSLFSLQETIQISKKKKKKKKKKYTFWRKYLLVNLLR